MKRLVEQRYFMRQNLLAFVGLCLCAYFSWHAVAGERSVLRLHNLHSAIEDVSVDYDSAFAQRRTLERKVVRLRPDTLDSDFLEERAQIVLGYYHPDERLIFYTP